MPWQAQCTPSLTSFRRLTSHHLTPSHPPHPTPSHTKSHTKSHQVTPSHPPHLTPSRPLPELIPTPCAVWCAVVCSGALKLANHYRLNVLAEHIQALLEQRLEWEEQQQAAAAAAQVGACGYSARAAIPAGWISNRWWPCIRLQRLPRMSVCEMRAPAPLWVGLTPCFVPCPKGKRWGLGS